MTLKECLEQQEKIYGVYIMSDVNSNGASYSIKKLYKNEIPEYLDFTAEVVDNDDDVFPSIHVLWCKEISRKLDLDYLYKLKVLLADTKADLAFFKTLDKRPDIETLIMLSQNEIITYQSCIDLFIKTKGLENETLARS